MQDASDRGVTTALPLAGLRLPDTCEAGASKLPCRIAARYAEPLVHHLETATWELLQSAQKGALAVAPALRQAME